MKNAEADFVRGDFDKARDGYLHVMMLDPRNYEAALSWATSTSSSISTAVPENGSPAPSRSIPIAKLPIAIGETR